MVYNELYIIWGKKLVAFYNVQSFLCCFSNKHNDNAQIHFELSIRVKLKLNKK